MSDKYPVMSSYKAIQTSYNGYRMRSRLEARWAVFLDTLGITYQYEPEGFDLDGMRYLPDFFLPQFDCWMEIKPDLPTPDEREKAIRLCRATSQEVVMFAGAPWHDTRGYSFSALTDGSEALQQLKQEIKANIPQAFWLSTDECIIADSDEQQLWGWNFARHIVWTGAQFTECESCRAIGPRGIAAYHHGNICTSPAFTCSSSHLLEAYTAARSARFEFGEKGGRI